MSDTISGRPIEILLVEDNPGDVRLTFEAFKEAKLGNRLHVAQDGQDALDFLRRRGKHADALRPDLILLDLNLPRKDGRQVLREVKADPELRQIPVIVLTVSRAEDDILKSYNLNANCYVSKPLELEQFLAVVRSIQNFWLTIVTLPSEAGR